MKAEFEAFWEEYPRKVGKGAARRAFARAVAKAAPETVMDALRAQKAAGFGADLVYTPHPTTWLNQERWEDDVAAATAAPRAGNH